MKEVITITREELFEKYDVNNFEALVFRKTKYSDEDIISMLPLVIASPFVKTDTVHEICRVDGDIYVILPIGDVDVPHWFAWIFSMPKKFSNLYVEHVLHTKSKERENAV